MKKLLFIGIIIFVMFTGCMNSTPLNQIDAVDHIKSLGGDNEPFTLWEGEPGCCKVIYYLRVEPDGALTMQDVELDSSRIYKDSDVDDARVVFTDIRGGYIRCDNMHNADWCKYRGMDNNVVYEFHVPKGTIITNYGVHHNNNKDSSDNDFNAAVYYTEYMSPISPLSPIHITSPIYH